MSDNHNYTEQEKLHYYEGDQSKLYSGILGHHVDYDSAESKNKIKSIWKITGILTLITIVEVAFGLFHHWTNPSFPHVITISIFLILTLVKAAYIVNSFMHLGDETKFFYRMIILPTLFLVWVVIAYLIDGAHWLDYNETFAHVIKAITK